MALSEEDKKRVEEEEAYRAKLQEEEDYRNQLKAKRSGKPVKKKGRSLWKTILIIFVCVSILNFIINQITGKNSPQGSSVTTPTPSRQATFVASVNFTGNQFVISNLDTHTCENAKMQVNDNYELNGYKLESGLNSVTQSGEVTVYKVGAAQFATKDGTRFNPYATKPTKFFISCRGDNELTGAYWYGEF
jgi:hypothetical protein